MTQQKQFEYWDKYQYYGMITQALYEISKELTEEQEDKIQFIIDRHTKRLEKHTGEWKRKNNEKMVKIIELTRLEEEKLQSVIDEIKQSNK
jgi:1-aminocyclopropane-1-carboxylate deaminase/D-cysteine desulfhydrase-like pyridoxal-dependent ACC family enzyme